MVYVFIQVTKENQVLYLQERANGLETTALIVEKESEYEGRIRVYDVILYVEKEVFKKRISFKQYKALEQGDIIQVVLKGDTVYFGNKQVAEESIHYVEKLQSNKK